MQVDITLIRESPEAHGVGEDPQELCRTMTGRKVSVGQKEFYEAMAHGLKPEMKIILLVVCVSHCIQILIAVRSDESSHIAMQKESVFAIDGKRYIFAAKRKGNKIRIDLVVHDDELGEVGFIGETAQLFLTVVCLADVECIKMDCRIYHQLS